MNRKVKVCIVIGAPGFDGERHSRGNKSLMTESTGALEDVCRGFLLQSFADGFQFPPAFRGDFGIGHLKFV